MTRSWFRRATALILLALFAVPARAAAIPEPKLVRVTLTSEITVERLLQAGLDVVEVHRGRDVGILEWPGDEARLASLGAMRQVVDEHPGTTAAARARTEIERRPALRPQPVMSAARADGKFRVEMLPPFGSGSLGGYWNKAEVKMKLDELVANDTHDVVAAKIDTIGYSRRNPIWGLKLGKHVDGPDTRPVVFLNALTHAREPGGMQSLFYFVDDILGKYGTDPWATYLLDTRVIYICPIVNPDGYAVNDSIYTSSGSFGFWRKNIRDNNANNVINDGEGVDINRNFGFRWGKDNVGSSPNAGDETYRGPVKFSEPETQVQRDIITQLHPISGLSFHTYSDLLLHPWGHTDSLPPHIAAFQEWSDELSRDNAYQTGLGTKILYSVNGEFNDWAYGDTLAKPRAFTWTPEMGTDVDGFWPPPSRILPIALDGLRPCYVVTAIAGPWVQVDAVTITEGAMNAGRGTHVSVRARNLGITGVAGPDLIGTMTALDAGVNVLTPIVHYPTLGSRQSGDPIDEVFQLAAHDSVTPGRILRFQIDFSAADGYFSRDTISIPCGTPTELLNDPATTTGNWTVTSGWTTVSLDPAHPSRYFTDSPGGNYGVGANLRLILKQRLDFTNCVHAYALYDTRWEYEKNYDSGFIEASLDSVTWVKLRATGTTPGSGLDANAQPLNAPVYAGTRWLWRTDVADLSPFTGAGANRVKLRFRTVSDGATNYDGWSLDSIRVVLYDPAAQPAPTAVGPRTELHTIAFAPPSPNPTNRLARFSFSIPRDDLVRLEIFDVTGRHVSTLANGPLAANAYVRGWDLHDDAGRRVAPGLYLARLSSTHGVLSRRFIVMD